MKIEPCKECGNKDIELYDCGYSSFNCYGGKCKSCGYKSGTTTGGCSPTKNEQIRLWNCGQKLTETEILEGKLKAERAKTRILRKQLRGKNIEPDV